MIPSLPFDVIIAETERVRAAQPLIHCLTNEVVQNFTANCLLALGASPAMIVAEQEVPTFTEVADNLLINVGTLYQQRSTAMELAAQTACNAGKMWVIDPVAVGLLAYRTQFTQSLLHYRPACIRGNASEILALSDTRYAPRGTDSQESSLRALPAAKALAQQYQTIVAITGETDYITDGIHTWAIPWGDPIMTRVTGCGCALSAVIATFLAQCDNPLTAVASACGVMAISGETAARQCQGPGTFVPHFIDALYQFPTHDNARKNSQ